MANRRPLSSLQRRLARYALVLSLGLVVGGGLFLVTQGPSTSWPTILSGLGLNLIASGIFAALFTFLSDREQRNLVVEEIRESFSVHSERLLGAVHARQAYFLPRATFAASKDYNPEFDFELSRAMLDASFYGFRGATAKYVSRRLALLSTCPATVIVVLADPRSESLMRRRVADRTTNPKYHGLSPAEIADSLRRELAESLVGLFDQRFKSTITVAFADETFVTRVEITDKTAFLALHVSRSSRTQGFPEEFQFDSGSLQYVIQRAELERRVELSSLKTTFSYSTTEEQLSKFLASVMLDPSGSVDPVPLRVDHQARMQGFDQHLTAILGHLNMDSRVIS